VIEVNVESPPVGERKRHNNVQREKIPLKENAHGRPIKGRKTRVIKGNRYPDALQGLDVAHRGGEKKDEENKGRSVSRAEKEGCTAGNPQNVRHTKSSEEPDTGPSSMLDRN